MLTDAELVRLLREGESDRVERKASASDTDGIREVICAFANDISDRGFPGVIFVGVNDNGSSSGLDITNAVLVTLAELRDDRNILPIPTMSVEKRRLNGFEVAVVIVQPSIAPPVRLRGRTRIRVGPRQATASVEDERRLNEKRRYRDQPFDLRPVFSATLSDLDELAFRETYLPSAIAPDVLAENRRDLPEQLASVRFATMDTPPSPTMLGMLIVGKDPRAFVPGAYIQFVRFDGDDLASPIKDEKEITDTVPTVLRVVDEVFRAHISTTLDITSGITAAQYPDYPLEALQQIARNAVIHRNYEDTASPVRVSWFRERIEIISPGGPYGQVNRDNFGNPGITDYRNPHLAEALGNLGFVQRFGVGIPRARAALAKNGNPDIEFVVQDSHVLAILRRRP